MGSGDLENGKFYSVIEERNPMDDWKNRLWGFVFDCKGRFKSEPVWMIMPLSEKSWHGDCKYR